MSESQHSADTQEMILKILDLSHTDARAALLILAASPYKKYREAAAKALRMVDWDQEKS